MNSSSYGSWCKEFKAQLILFRSFVSNYLSYKIKHFWENVFDFYQIFFFFLVVVLWNSMLPPFWFMAASWRRLAIAANDVSAKLWRCICSRKHCLITLRFWNWHYSTNSFVYSLLFIWTVYFLNKFRTRMTSFTFITSPLQDAALNQDGGNLSSFKVL